MRMLDLFCGRFGWSRAFAARGWECVGVDLVKPPEIPEGCTFVKADILSIADLQNMVFPVECLLCQGSGNFYGPADEDGDYLPCDDCDHGKVLARFGMFDFICASSPCEQFSVHGMKHFHPNPPYPELGIWLFNHTRSLCEASGVPYVMENVRAAQQFVGGAVHHCGPFYLWGTGVPAIMPQGINKGIRLGGSGSEYGGKGYPILTREEKRERRKADPMLWASSGSPERKAATALAATIPPELSACVAAYAERLIEQAELEATA